MLKQAILAVFAALALLGIFVSLNENQTPAQSESKTHDLTEQDWQRAKEAPISISAVNVASVKEAQSNLASGLLIKLANERKSGENIIVSPASLALALAVIDLGADNDLKSAIGRTLGFEPPPNDNRRGYDLSALRQLFGEMQSDKVSSDVFATASAIVMNPDIRAVQATLDEVAKSGAIVFRKTLSAPDALVQVNDWFSARTNGRISSILDAAPLDEGLIVLNSVYFFDKWQFEFEVARTHRMPFRLVDGSSRDVRMMTVLMEQALVRSDDSFVAVDLPYKDNRFSLVVITTRDGVARASRFSTVLNWLTGQDFKRDTIDLSLPRLEMGDTLQLLGVLKTMGLKDSLSSPTALSRFSSEPIKLSQIVQKAFFKVDESGTEAAAATTVLATRSPFDPNVKSVVFDKPFIFSLRDDMTGLILLSGYIGKPAQETEEAPKIVRPKPR
jgi:serine protease inhibitor